MKANQNEPKVKQIGQDKPRRPWTPPTLRKFDSLKITLSAVPPGRGDGPLYSSS
jgi:hypothetical protein